MKFSVAIVEGRRVLCSTQADAKELDRNYERIDIPVDHDGLKAYVQALFDEVAGVQRSVDGCETITIATADIRDDKDGEPSISHTIPAETAPVKFSGAPNYTEWSCRIDEEFDKLPIARQLDFAASAMSNARNEFLRLNKLTPGGIAKANLDDGKA